MSGILFDRARSSPDPPWGTIGELVREAAERSGGQEFLRFPGVSLTFAAAHQASNRLAHVLVAHGIRPGDRVAIMLGNVPDWPLSWFAVLKVGAIAVPVQLTPGYQPDTKTALSLLDHARAKLAPFKVPAYLEFVESFPLTPSARVRKHELLQPGRDQRKGVFDATANAWV